MADLHKLDKAIKELEEQSFGLKNFTNVYTEISKLKNDISENLKIIKENNKSLNSLSFEVKKRLEEFDKRIDAIDNVFSKRIQELYQDSKAFQKELDNSLASRLEKHKSDIQVELRSESVHIKRTIENLIDSNYNKLESTIRESNDNQMSQIKTLKIMLLISIIVEIGLAVGVLVK